jgi:phosphatidylserine/phosphatidylglycerophosphate/cardiolipin synthase-like enzyme
MSKTYLVLAAALVLGTACNATNSADDTAIDARGPDAPDGTGCTTTTPRTQVPETFVGPSGWQTRLDALIDGAQTQIDVQMYLFTITGFANKIVAAKQRGVAVRVILDPDEAGNANVTPIFTQGGVAWKNSTPIYTYSHAKYLIIDHTAAVIMSMNFNVDAVQNERNYGFVDKDPEDVADVQAVFEQDWGLANGQTPALPNLTCTRLIITPNNSQQRLLALINGAHSTLDIEVLYLSETTTRNAVGAAKARGVTVRAIIEDPAAPEVAYMKNLGIPVKYPQSFYLHAKLVIADGVAFVGSQNFSYTSLTKNREVGALIFEPSAVVPIQAQFDTDWNGSPSVP